MHQTCRLCTVLRRCSQPGLCAILTRRIWLQNLLSWRRPLDTLGCIPQPSVLPPPPPTCTFKAPPPAKQQGLGPPPSGPGWSILGYTHLGPVWFDTVAHYTTYRAPNKAPAVPQHHIETWSDIQGVTRPVPPPPPPYEPPALGFPHVQPPLPVLG